MSSLLEKNDLGSSEDTQRTVESGISAWRFTLRVALIAIQVLAVYWMSAQGNPFFYQGF